MMLDIKKFAMAWALTFALIYFGCFYLMSILGREASIVFFNTLMHGIDFRSVFRMDMPFWELAVGSGATFIIGWLVPPWPVFTI